jgi:hypothetical protein
MRPLATRAAGRSFVRGLPLALASLAACAPSASLTSARAAPSVAAPPALADDRAAVRAFAAVEDDALGWLSAADPRLAVRANVCAPDAVLAAIGQEAVLAEDAAAQIRGRSLDLFAFRARAHALAEAGKRAASFAAPLPETGTEEDTLARPRLERELLVRLVAEEQARAVEEAKLGDAAGDLVRGILATWTAPDGTDARDRDARDRDARDRDADRDSWVSARLRLIRDGLRAAPPRDGPFDLDVALYPLERLLAPLEFPRGSAAIAEVRVVMDQDMGAGPALATPARVADGAKAHLGVDADAAALAVRLAALETRLHREAEQAVASGGLDRNAVEARARALLFVARPCTPPPRTRVRAIEPPPERAAICGAVRGLAEAGDAATALFVLHDDVLLAIAAVTTSPPPRTALLSKPEDDRVDDIRRDARERPVVALGLALAAELIYAGRDPAARIAAWNALGDAPLDVVARELPP